MSATITTPLPASPPTNSPVWLLQWLRWRLLRNTLRVVLRQSAVRVLTILLCSIFIWVSLFGLSYLGFADLKNPKWGIPLDFQIMGLLFDLMFLTLTVLLIFSTGIILYSSLFGSAETTFLLSGPLSEDHIFAHKFQGAVGFSSWGFVLLGSPILVSYGLLVNDGAPWYFYVMLPLFFLGFVLLPGCMGALCCLLVVNYLPQRRKTILVLSIAALVCGIGAWLYARVVPNVRQAGQSDWLQQLMGEFAPFRGPLMPAHWIAQGLQSAALGDLSEAVYYLAVIWANGLFLYILTAWLAKRLYRRGFDRLAAGTTTRKRYGTSWMDRVLGGSLFFLDAQTRLLTIKDFRTFRRDPAQWAQVLIFVGLSVLYFSNMRRFYEQDFRGPFQNGISIINLVAVSFLMCAYTGRFIFPMLSLEGRKFWILGLFPLRRDRLVWGKFVFSATGCLVVSELLIVVSDVMLNLPWFVIVLHAATIGVLSLAFSGLSVGLGACLPNFRESDPSKIAVGFGGTLNLVAGLLLLFVVVGLMAVPSHVAMGEHMGNRNLSGAGTELGIVLGACLGGVFGLVATLVPLYVGAWALRKMEF